MEVLLEEDEIKLVRKKLDWDYKPFKNTSKNFN